MHHYIDIHLRPDPEFPQHQLMAALYAKLHRVLAQHQTQTIGVAFPGYSAAGEYFGLGNTLRLLGTQGDLQRLIETPWLQSMRDHVRQTTIATIPTNASYRSLRRVQAKSSPERLRRRQMRRHGFTQKQAQEQIPDSAAERLKLPFISIGSSSTGHRFSLFLALGAPAAQPVAGRFNAYGLSATATVPWF